MARKPEDRSLRIIKYDPLLKPYESDIRMRMEHYRQTRRALLGDEGDLTSFANGYLYYGISRCEDGWVYREWAPAANEMYFFGDFNGWNPKGLPMQKLADGSWEVYLHGHDALRHGQRVKVRVWHNGEFRDRIPLYIRKVIQDENGCGFCGVVWAPDHPFEWTDDGYRLRRHCVEPLIYEAHVGMAQEEPKIGSYREFADRILPRIAALGYNTVQLMAVMQHPYYASFGYQVSSFFAASSWFGDPDDLKYLINKAHGMGLRVLLDVVHAHAASNVEDGIACFDGTDEQFFVPGEQGHHPAWGTRLFRYGSHGVLHFLLSNLKFWLEEYHFDGFRFDGVTSMLYHSHGLGMRFDNYRKYFSMDTNIDAVAYLQLANELVHTLYPKALTIAEDMSGMPGMCLPVEEGGVGFNARLSMGIPDLWIKMLKEQTDEQWSMGSLWYELTTRRPNENNIGYCESHDQALVGDKTLIFRMADAEMYTGMDRSRHSPAMDRAIALHKMIRLITFALAGEGYLNFMGNEFGHPEWIDFPREGNGWSSLYARRQWSLADNGYLKYGWLRDFDSAMLMLARKYRFPGHAAPRCLYIDEQKKIIACERDGLIFLFNFHPVFSDTGFVVPLGPSLSGTYRVILSTDQTEFGGNGRIDERYEYHTDKSDRFTIYLPSRTAAVLKKV